MRCSPTLNTAQAGPYGFSKDAAPFDAAVGRWAASLHAEELLGEAARRQHGAKSCGFLGMVLLHGMLRRGMAGAVGTADGGAGVTGKQLTAGLVGKPTGAHGQPAAGHWSLQQPSQGLTEAAGAGVQGTWRGHLLALHHPTYFGMAVASFERLGLQGVAEQ